MQPDGCRDNNFVVTYCHDDKLQCLQWRQSWYYEKLRFFGVTFVITEMWHERYIVSSHRHFDCFVQQLTQVSIPNIKLLHYCSFVTGTHWWIPIRNGQSMQGLCILFVLGLHNMLNKQSSCWWFDTPWRSCDLWLITVVRPEPSLSNTEKASRWFLHHGNLWTDGLACQLASVDNKRLCDPQDVFLLKTRFFFK